MTPATIAVLQGLVNKPICSKTALSQSLKLLIEEIEQSILELRKMGVVIFDDENRVQLKSKLSLLNEEVIQQAVGKPQIRVLITTKSTNQYLYERIGQLQWGEACLAEYQSAGRGQRGKAWYAPFGSNLCLSLYWKFSSKNLHPESLTGLSIVVGIVVAKLLRKLGVAKSCVKWPNDIYADEKKLAGILVELVNRSDGYTHTVIGIGLNVERHSILNDCVDQPYTTLRDQSIQLDRNQLAIHLITQLRIGLLQFERKGLMAFIKDWVELDCFYDMPVRVIREHDEVNGIARGIDETGALLLDVAGKILSFQIGTVSLRSKQHV